MRVRRFPFTAEGAEDLASEAEVEDGSPSAGRVTAVEVDASALGVSGLDVGRPESSAAELGIGKELAGELRLIFARRWADHRPCIERFNAFEPYLSACKRYTRSGSAGAYRDLHLLPASSYLDSVQGSIGLEEDGKSQRRRNGPFIG